MSWQGSAERPALGKVLFLFLQAQSVGGNGKDGAGLHPRPRGVES